MKTIDELVDLVIQWSSDRKILQNGKIETQCLKLISEVGELADNIAKEKDIRDDIGDILVLLINISSMNFVFKTGNEKFIKGTISHASEILALYSQQEIRGSILKCIAKLTQYVGNTLYCIDYNTDDIRTRIEKIVLMLFYICEAKNTTLQECLNIAYNDIKDRKGTTLSNGCFVKETT